MGIFNGGIQKGFYRVSKEALFRTMEILVTRGYSFEQIGERTGSKLRIFYLFLDVAFFMN